MTKPGDLEGKCLRVNAMDTKLGGELVGDRPGGRNAAIDQLRGDGDRVGERVQVEANQDGGSQEAVRGSRVDQRLHGNGRLARDVRMLEVIE